MNPESECCGASPWMRDATMGYVESAKNIVNSPIPKKNKYRELCIKK